MLVEDSLPIKGMKKSDFIQLEGIFDHFKETGVYWGRKDYWDKRMDRIETWLLSVNVYLQSNDVKIKEEGGL